MNRAFLIGLTGSIGMGKSTTAAMFAALGIPVWDADAAVADLYGPGGEGSAAIADLFPDAATEHGVDREKLRLIIAASPDALARIEARIHPLVAAHRSAFVENCEDDIALLDIPLLFEIGADQSVDHIVVVSAPPDIQRARVLARPGMTPDRFDAILARQLADSEKRARADTVIETLSLDATRAAVESLVKNLRQDIDARNRS